MEEIGLVMVQPRDRGIRREDEGVNLVEGLEMVEVG